MVRKAEPKKKSKILIIDDDVDLLHTLKEVLVDEGYGIIMASNGIEAIERHKESRPDLIILDLKMPQMNGIETLRNIRKVDKDVIVIILTGYGSAETIREAVDLNVHEYISKPFTLDVITNAVKESLSKKRDKNA